MLITQSTRVRCLAVAVPLLLSGCSGGGSDQPSGTPTPAKTPAAAVTAAPTAAASVSPSAALTPGDNFSPLGGKPLSEEEKEYLNKLQQAKDLALAKNYEKAVPLLDELHAQKPEDLDVMFYLMLSHGSTEAAPSKTSKAFEYAQKVLAGSPDSREGERARSYINSANFAVPPNFKYGTATIGSGGGWVLNETATYKATVDMPFHSAISGRLSPGDQAVLWETEASPSTATTAEKLAKGTEVKVISTKEFLYGLTSWRKPIKNDFKEFDPTIFDVAAMYIEVTGEGPLKGKKGWVVNQVDRWQAAKPEGEDEWGVWITNRLKVDRNADLEPAKP